MNVEGIRGSDVRFWCLERRGIVTVVNAKDIESIWARKQKQIIVRRVRLDESETARVREYKETSESTIRVSMGRRLNKSPQGYHARSRDDEQV